MNSISRWLSNKCYRPREIWEIANKYINPTEPSILVADDTILEKPRSEKIELVHYQYSGNTHDVVADIGMVNLLWHGLDSQESVPVDYRIYDKNTDGKTKNAHFCDMLKLAKEGGLHLQAVVMDSWYSSLDNLKSIRSDGWDWVTTLRKNRVVNRNVRLETLSIPNEGLSIHLRGYGWITVFKFESKNGPVDYVATSIKKPRLEQVKALVKARWSIEVYHRQIKQPCGIERCQARTGRAQRNHIFLAVAAWFKQQAQRLTNKITLYQQNWEVIKLAIRQQINFLLT